MTFRANHAREFRRREGLRPRPLLRAVFGVLCLGGFLPSAGFPQSHSAVQARSLETAFVEIAESVQPTVVLIRTEGAVRHPDVQSEEGSPAPPSGFVPRRGYGAGIIYDSRGFILTNHHVLEGAKRIYVTLFNGDEYPADLMGSDRRTDLAVVRIHPRRPLRVAPIGDSSRLKVGQWAVVVGHPFGLERSVTVGVVSGIGRRGMGIAHYEDFIQTDASIHPGNSGGPLVNLEGQVVGINTAVIPRTNGGGIGLAIPSNMAREVADKLIRDGRVVRGFLGVMIQDLSREMAPKFGLTKPEGALVSDLMNDGASARAGLKRGDVILKFDDRPVRDVADLQRMTAASSPGSRVTLEIQRRRKRLTVPLVLDTLRNPQAPEPEVSPGEDRSPYGLSVGELTRGMTEVLARRGVEGGVQVTAVSPESRAARDGLQVGDVIREVEHHQVLNPEDFRNAIREGPNDVLVLLYRLGASSYRILHDPR